MTTWRIRAACLIPNDTNTYKKEHLRGQKFAHDNEVMEAVQSWLEATPKKLFFFSVGHPQACGHVDQLCCEAGGLSRKIRYKQLVFF
jgi:hypothetical protein